jgi:hypothetical protein
MPIGMNATVQIQFTNWKSFSYEEVVTAHSLMQNYRYNDH